MKTICAAKCQILNERAWGLLSYTYWRRCHGCLMLLLLQTLTQCQRSTRSRVLHARCESLQCIGLNGRLPQCIFMGRAACCYSYGCVVYIFFNGGCVKSLYVDSFSLKILFYRMLVQFADVYLFFQHTTLIILSFAHNALLIHWFIYSCYLWENNHKSAQNKWKRQMGSKVNCVINPVRE